MRLVSPESPRIIRMGIVLRITKGAERIILSRLSSNFQPKLDDGSIKFFRFSLFMIFDQSQVDGWEKLTGVSGHGSHGVTLTFVTSGRSSAYLVLLCYFTEFYVGLNVYRRVVTC